MSQEAVTSLTILLPAILLTLGLALFVLNDVYIERRSRKILLIICGLVFILIAQNYMDYLLQTRFVRPFGRTICGIVGYSIRPAILAAFCYIVGPKRRHWLAWMLTGLNAAVYFTALFSRLVFWINENNTFHKGPLNPLCFIVSVVLLAYLLFLSIRAFRFERERKSYILLLPALMIIGSILLDYQVGRELQPITFLTIAVVLCSVFYYTWLHLQFVQKHEQEIVDGQRVQIMLSQIQPHFLYNTLGAIQSTYNDDPIRAAEAVGQFTDFLRHNMDSLTDDQPISFAQEMEHVKCYLKLLELRFGDALNVTCDLECTDFRLPTLTLQPLVENAVTYGVRKNDRGKGHIIIRSREYPDRYEVSVIDDGPGFVPDTLPEHSERSHIGLQNVRERMGRVTGGELKIYSVLGEGTTATIILPKEVI